MFTRSKFEPEPWMGELAASLPSSRVSLARLPTPTHVMRTPADIDVEVSLKRDDMTSFELSGNKVRKLEFLLADALEKGYDSVVTIGGVQSNHCRATAVASRQLGLEPHLILRTDDPASIGLTGNLLMSRMAGTCISTVTPDEYNTKGSEAIVQEYSARILESDGKKCYPIPCGGSNALGTFGYINAVSELLKTCVGSDGAFPYDHIVFGCGSGGTAAGLAIGVHLSGVKTKVHAIGVCDSPGEFYDVIHTLATELGLKGGCATDCTAMRPALTVEDVRSWLSIYDGQGMGYAISTEDELRFITEISGLSGIGFDPVYSGKALYKLFDILRQQKTLETEQRAFLPHEKVLFIHTGGILGMYDKIPQLLPLISEQSKIRKLEIS